MTQPFGHLPIPSPLTEAERIANYEHTKAALRRAQIKPTEPDATRSAILNAMGAWSDAILAKHEVMALLEQHEVNLRASWEHAELGLVRKRFEDALRGACRAVMEGQLL